MRYAALLAALLLGACVSDITAPDAPKPSFLPEQADSVIYVGIVCTIYIDYEKGRYWETCPRPATDTTTY